MPKKTFSTKDKKAAVQAMIIGNLTQKQIAKKFKCSVAVLQHWRKDPNNNPQITVENEWSDEECEECRGKREKGESAKEETTQTECPYESNQSVPQDAIYRLQRRFWNQNFRGVDLLLEPRDFSPKEVIELVNEALLYAYVYDAK